MGSHAEGPKGPDLAQASVASLSDGDLLEGHIGEERFSWFAAAITCRGWRQCRTMALPLAEGSLRRTVRSSLASRASA